jgi:hypothetical protein
MRMILSVILINFILKYFFKLVYLIKFILIIFLQLNFVCVYNIIDGDSFQFG